MKSDRQLKFEKLETEVNILRSVLKTNLLNNDNELLQRAVEELRIVVQSNTQQYEALPNFGKEDKF